VPTQEWFAEGVSGCSAGSEGGSPGAGQWRGAEQSSSSTRSVPGWCKSEQAAACEHRVTEQSVSRVVLVYSQPLPDPFPVLVLHAAVLCAGTVVFRDVC